MSSISDIADNECMTCQWTNWGGYLIGPKVTHLRFQRANGMYVYLVRKGRKLYTR